MDNKHLGLIMTAFIAILLGLILLDPIADNIEDVSVSSILESNETITLNSTGIDGGADDNETQQTTATALTQVTVLSLTTVRNITSEDITDYCDLTLATRIVNCTATGSTTAYIDYTYEPADYIHNSAAATLIRLTIIFFALAIFAIGLGYAWKSLKESGMI